MNHEEHAHAPMPSSFRPGILQQIVTFGDFEKESSFFRKKTIFFSEKANFL